MSQDYEGLEGQGSSECNILAPALCSIVNVDAYTLVLVIWSTLQLTWVTMLLFVQLVQVSRAVTTWENMRGMDYAHGNKASEAITSALTTGTLSRNGAQVGPEPTPHGNHNHHHHHGGGCFAQWKKLLGVDTFIETALHRPKEDRSSGNKNPFSRGCIGNCRDFWCDPAPIFGKRDNGAAMLGGHIVNYTSMYEPPPRMTSHRAAPEGIASGRYESVETDEIV